MEGCANVCYTFPLLFLSTNNIISIFGHKVTRDIVFQQFRSLHRLLENGLFYGQSFIYVMGGLNTALMFAAPPRCALMLLSVGCAWFVSRLYHTFIARTNPKTLRGLARALSESAAIGLADES